ncbi:MAG: disulfide bond formation protein B [Legionella sp.]|uniref:disulfide bond formation protein B n=1 Tax=Legionella sp. TaxID=459 RepID=UPI0039E31EEE
MTKLMHQRIQTFNALVTLFVLFASFYFQYGLGLAPCPLCIMQRVCVFILLGLMSLSFRTLRRAHWVSFLQVFFAAAGLFFALRQLWLQSLPESQVPACMPGFDILVRYFPWKTIAQTMLWGTGDCAEATWHLWGISMAGWSAMYFAFMLLMGLFLFWCTRPLGVNRNNPLL